MLNVAYVLLVDELTAMVADQRRAAMTAQYFTKKILELPDTADAQRRFDEQLASPLPEHDPVRSLLREAIGLT